ncbi:site-specific integrase [Streptomyces sp. B21-105]
MRVRGFYLDIQEWAHDDPFWAQWAVPSPITRGDGAGNHKIVAQVHSRMHQRVRERLPRLPVLLETAERVRSEAAALLEAARATPFEEVFEHEGTRYLRILPKVNQIPSRLDHGSQHVYIKEVYSTGRRINQSIVEDDAFWAWAAIETLRHTGVRAEELTELTHLALVSYKLPDTSEIVPLLQIVPSKSNEERLLLVSPELASVLATIVKRLRDANDGKIPLVARYDQHERVTGPQLPRLFQRRPYWQAQVLNETSIKRFLDRTLVATGLRDAAGEPLRYTPHDFRRMFATEAVTGGLPVHIAARILGHKTLATTQAYLAVFQDDLVRTYRSFLDRRRADRPQEEYREPTEQEWRDFQQHFELRKVSLGTCGRPTGPPASTNTPAFAARSSRSTPASVAASSRSSRTFATASARPAATAGSEKSKDSRSVSTPPPPSSTASAGPRSTADPNWSTSACPSSPTPHRRVRENRENTGPGPEALVESQASSGEHSIHLGRPQHGVGSGIVGYLGVWVREQMLQQRVRDVGVTGDPAAQEGLGSGGELLKFWHW